MPVHGWFGFFARMLPALAVMGTLAWAAAGQFAWTGSGAHLHGLVRAGALLLIVVLCALAYFAVLYALGFRVRDIKRSSV